jgi:hypothetical protein
MSPSDHHAADLSGLVVVLRLTSSEFIFGVLLYPPNALDFTFEDGIQRFALSL